MLKLGDKVQFSKHYKSNTANYFNAEYSEANTEEQNRTWDEEDYAVVSRVNIIEHRPKSGFICGKRNIVIENTIEFLGYVCGSYDEPDYPQYDLKSTMQQVYLVACNMAGFYRVHPDWIEPSERGGE